MGGVARRVGERVRGAGLVPEWSRRERLWWAAVAVALVADTLSTLAGLRMGYAEGNPVARTALLVGPAGLVGLKLAVVGLAACCGSLLEGPSRLAAPAALALTWTVATCLNVTLLLTG